MASKFIPPSSFLSPLGPIAWIAQAEGDAATAGAKAVASAARIGVETARDIAAGARAGAVQAYGNSFLNPLGVLGINPLDSSTYPGGKGGVLPDLGKAGDDVNKLANKALLGELILVGGVVALAGIAAVFFSRRPETFPGYGPLASAARLLGSGNGGGKKPGDC